MKIRLKESERDLLRTANEVLSAAQQTLSRAEAVWKLVLDQILTANSIDPDRMQSLVLQDDMKYLVCEEKPHDP